jgi:putative transposase
MLIISERHLRLVLGEYAGHYNTHRPHRTLNQNPPAGRQDQPAAGTSTRVLRQDRLGGLVYEYSQVACGGTISGTHRGGVGLAGPYALM